MHLEWQDQYVMRNSYMKGQFQTKLCVWIHCNFDHDVFPNICPTACFSEELWLTRKAAWFHRSKSGLLAVERWNAVGLVGTAYVNGDFSTQASPWVSAITTVPMGHNPFKLRFISLHSN